MSNQKSGGRTWRCSRRSLPPIASSNDPISRPSIPDEWTRLKVEYERQCYQDAEKAARERLVLLQTSSTCEIEPVPQRKPAPSIPDASGQQAKV